MLSTSLNRNDMGEAFAGLSPDTAVGKTQNEHFILVKSVFFSLLILLDPAAASDSTGHAVQNGQGI